MGLTSVAKPGRVMEVLLSGLALGSLQCALIADFLTAASVNERLGPSSSTILLDPSVDPKSSLLLKHSLVYSNCR